MIMTDNNIEIKEKWNRISDKLEKMFDMDINMESVLFLIGLRELGSNGKRDFSKEEKTDLMHIAMCKLLSQAGFYRLTHIDQEGWPYWELVTPLPTTDLMTQTRFLKILIIDYFTEVWEEV